MEKKDLEVKVEDEGGHELVSEKGQAHLAAEGAQ